jgi:hypothetical protein
MGRCSDHGREALGVGRCSNHGREALGMGRCSNHGREALGVGRCSNRGREALGITSGAGITSGVDDEDVLEAVTMALAALAPDIITKRRIEMERRKVGAQ